MNRKTVIIIVVIVVIIIIAVAAYLIYKNVKSSQDLGDTETDETETDDKQTYVAPVVTQASDKPSNIKAFQDWMDANHPGWVKGKNLNKGSGYGTFGPSTQAAWATWKNDYNKKSVGCPQGTYPFGGGCRPIGGTTPKPTTGFQKGKAVYAKSPGLVLHKYPSGNSSIGTIPNNFDISKPIGIYEASSSEGFSKIWVNVYGVSHSGFIIKAPYWAYVYTGLIK